MKGRSYGPARSASTAAVLFAFATASFAQENSGSNTAAQPKSEAKAPSTTGTDGKPRPVSLFKATRPDATVVVSKHPSGADLVQISVVSPDYPPSALQAACTRVGELTNVPVRGLSVTNVNSVVRASFATGNLITEEVPHFRIGPLMKALGYSTAPLKKLAVIFEGYQADRETVNFYRNEADTLRIEANRLPNGVEYRTFLGDIPESDVVLPGGRQAPTPVTPSAQGPDLVLPAILGIGAIAAGVLVYSLVARPKARAKARGR